MTRLMLESLDTLLILVLSVAMVIVLIASVAVLGRRRQAQSATDEARRKPSGEQPCDMEQQILRGSEGGEPQRAEQEHHWAEQDLRRPEEEPRNGKEETHGGEKREHIDRESLEEAAAQLQKDELHGGAEKDELSEPHETQPESEEVQDIDEERSASDEEGGHVLEETRHKQEGEYELPEEEEGHKDENVRLKLKKERKRSEPSKRGGRPRTSNRDSRGGSLRERQPRYPKPEIVCWKEEGQWVAAVEIPEELLGKPSLAVLQDGSPLTKEESREGCWRIERVFGEVVVQWNEGEGVQETTVALPQDGYLLFKLSGQDQNQGCRVKSLSSGSYLVMVPDSWERDDTLSGPPPVTPESVFLPGYRAHFFELEKGSNKKIAFHTPVGESFVIESSAPQFELVGNRLNDASEDKGPLFGGAAPRIRALDEQGWKNVGTIDIDEDGIAKKGWRTSFTPDSDGREQNLPSEFSDRNGGWYLLTFRDTEDNVIERLHFRFTRGLKEIKLVQPSPLPSGDGHAPVSVEFLHEPGFDVQPVDFSINIQIERQGEKTTLTIPPNPKYDETGWSVGPVGGPQVEVTILVERLWWGIGEEHNVPSEWKDKALTLAREDFAATSNKALWLRLPRLRWVNKVLVGFGQEKARPYDVKVTEKTIAFPLREFGDSKEVGDAAQEYSLRVWLERGGRFTEGVIAVIPASIDATEWSRAVSLPGPHWVGFGRKKKAVAKAVLQAGSGNIRVNRRPLDDYFKEAPRKAKQFLQRLSRVEQVRETLSHMDMLITVTGSSVTTMRQAKAVAHAIARALMTYDPKLKLLLKQAGFGGARVKKISNI